MSGYFKNIPIALVPTVVEQTQRGERGWDLFSRLLNDRIVIKHDTERDNFMSVDEAKDYGLIDEVMTSGRRPG